MTPKNWLTAAACALALGFSVLSAQAAPVSSALSDVRSASSEIGAIEPVHYRNGYRHHHRYGYGNYWYGYRRHHDRYYYGRGYRHDRRHW